MARVLIYAIPVVLAVWALVDLFQTPKAAVRWMAKPFWLIAVIGLPVLGPVVWLLGGASRTGGRGPGGLPRQPRPVAPDDDPDFLRTLDDEQRRRRRQAPPEDSSGDATGANPAD